jgi:methyl-accepting chemotaxis protein
MNAAIEAAHAGTAGKGFAIVAQSIRKLADNTTSSTKSINEHIIKMNDSINAGLDKFEKQQEVFASLSDNTDELNSLITNISNELTGLNSKVKNNYQDIEELLNATDKLKGNMHSQKENNIVIEKLISNLNSISETVKNLNSGIVTQISSINDIFASLNTEYSSTVNSIEKLQKLVTAFKT